MNDNERRPGNSNDDLDLVTCSLANFAAVVRRNLGSVGHDVDERFGTRKVFIAAAHAALVAAGHDVGAFAGFASRLILAQRAGWLALARADLVAAMPRQAVAASEITGDGTTYHFIVDASARDPWNQDASVDLAA